MALLSPGVELKETSVQSTIVNNATGRAAIAGKFQWGPAFQVIQVTNEVELVDLFGTPNSETADYFMSAMNFLQYGNDLRVARAVNRDVAKNSSPIAENIETTISAAGSNYAVGDVIRVRHNMDVIETAGKVTRVDADGKILGVYIPTGKIIAYAKSTNQYPALGPNWTAEITSSSSGVSGTITLGKIITDSGILLTEPENAYEAIRNTIFQDSLKKYGMPGVVALYPGEIGSQLEIEIVSKAAYEKGAATELSIYPTGGSRVTTARAVFGYGPQTDDQYAIIVRRDGAIVESVVLSTKEGEKDIYGNNIYMDDYFAKGSSNYIFGTAMNWPKGFSGIIKLNGGLSANTAVTAGDVMQAWDLFADREALHVNLLIAGACAGEGLEFASTVQKHVSSIADERQDCLALISPPRETIVNIPLTRAIDNLVNWRTAATTFIDNNMNISSTYSFIDGNYKYQYDKYNDVNRWVPLAADIAGLCARTDNISQPWMSPAGYNRGQILNVIKLAIEARQPQRDRLYQEAINPVTGTGGDGFVLFGDKTATKVPTPFDRVNVRRLFNMLKTNIGNSSKYRLFEINDNFTRSSFRMETSQYLQGIKALGGMYEYRVVCDTTNNTPAVIDRNEFVASFYIKPARSINYITLNFVATATGADFDELIGPQ
ncbi:tail sheath [Salmonella phage vB_SnwM_CGG4-1]|uniref:Tail sheath protein n=1 Tax=Salmonella phage vB_SnwM_CGG4-1 TaxID=1815631 RepID=A0A1B0VVG0_9CAUD|nr:tail sheath [Salmonella phage vB_SnwM_CGG4-1]ANA49506.1 tail sheath protein [Salmonella phage vB_SnwM_CGG4-1]